jgi:hypothetical protein
VSKTAVHGVGQFGYYVVDLTWAYVNKYGFDNNKYTGTGGNNKIMNGIRWNQITTLQSDIC